MFFHALTFAGSRGRCLNTRPLGRVYKHRPRDQASVNAIKQNMYDRYSCIFYLIPTSTALKTSLIHLNIHFLTLDFSKQNGVSSNFRTSLRRHNVINARNVFANKSISEMTSHGRNAFPCNVIQTIQGPVWALAS